MLTIGAVDSAGDYVSFSSIGPTVDGRIKPDVMAKGLNAAVVSSNGNVTTSSGTSFSSPIMAGAIASFWQVRPQTPNAQIMQLVRESAHIYNNPTDEMGYGIPNFEDAYNSLITLGVEDQLRAEQFALYPNPVRTNINVSFPEGISQADFTLYNIIGEQVINTKVSKVNNWVDLSELVRGMYFATIKSDAKTNSFKLIKE